MNASVCLFVCFLGVHMVCSAPAHHWSHHDGGATNAVSPTDPLRHAGRGACGYEELCRPCEGSMPAPHVKQEALRRERREDIQLNVSRALHQLKAVFETFVNENIIGTDLTVYQNPLAPHRHHLLQGILDGTLNLNGNITLTAGTGRTAELVNHVACVEAIYEDVTAFTPEQVKTNEMRAELLTLLCRAQVELKGFEMACLSSQCTFACTTKAWRHSSWVESLLRFVHFLLSGSTH